MFKCQLIICNFCQIFAMITCMQFLLVSCFDEVVWLYVVIFQHFVQFQLKFDCYVLKIEFYNRYFTVFNVFISSFEAQFFNYLNRFSLLKQFFFPLLPSIAINPLSLDHCHLCLLLYLVPITPQDCFKIVVTQFLLLLCYYNIILTFDSA